MEKRWTAKNDLLFKKVFASPKWRHILIGFLEDILSLEIEDVTIENPYSIETFYQDLQEKRLLHTEVDVLARLKDETLVTIEIQVHPQLFFKERALFYLANKYLSNYGRKKEAQLPQTHHSAKYSSLYPTYGINIVDFNLFPEDEAVLHHFTLYERALQQVFQNKEEKSLFNLTFFELKKHPDQKTQQHVRYWLQYFNSGKVDKKAPAYIQEASRIITYQNLEKEERKMVDVLEKAREDYKATILYAKQEGLEKGIEKGIEKGRKEGLEKGRKEGLEKGIEKGRKEAQKALAKKLMRMNLSLEQIQEATGLTREELNQVR